MCYEVVDGAIHHSEGPIRVEEEDEVESAVEQWHHKIRNGKIYQEVISDGTHSPMSWNKSKKRRETYKSHINIFMIPLSINGDVLYYIMPISNFFIFYLQIANFSQKNYYNFCLVTWVAVTNSKFFRARSMQHTSADIKILNLYRCKKFVRVDTFKNKTSVPDISFFLSVIFLVEAITLWRKSKYH